jgi:hypothetical protein
MTTLRCLLSIRGWTVVAAASVEPQKPLSGGRRLLTVVDDCSQWSPVVSTGEVHAQHRRAVFAFALASVLLVPSFQPAPQTPADNTTINTRDRATGAVTADQQKEDTTDRALTQKTSRRAYMVLPTSGAASADGLAPLAQTRRELADRFTGAKSLRRPSRSSTARRLICERKRF